MENTQTNNSPQPPKKSFWAKLFGSKTAATPAPVAPPLVQDSAASEPLATDVAPIVNTVVPVSPPVSSDVPAVAPVVQDIAPIAAPVVSVDPLASVPSQVQGSIPAQNTAWSAPAVVEEMPIPPTDPMVTPISSPQVGAVTTSSVVDAYQPVGSYSAPESVQYPDNASPTETLEVPVDRPPLV